MRYMILCLEVVIGGLRGLLLLDHYLEDPQVFKPNGIYALAQGEVTQPAKPEGLSNEPSTAPKVKLQVWTATWCGYCPAAIAEATTAANELGIPIELVDYDQWASFRDKAKVSAPPTVCIVVGDKSYEQIRGGAKSAELVSKVKYWRHKFSPESSQQATVSAAPLPEVIYAQPDRYAYYGGVKYDLATWSRMCSMKRCGMCNYLDMMAANYRAGLRASIPSPQSASPADVVDEAIAIAKLTSSDVVAELGSGSGEPAIRMVQKSGCRVVGVEIDHQKVVESRALIASKGLSDRITIIEGDVRQFDPSKYGVTVVYAYLYPELLSQITAILSHGRIAICPGHKPDGLDMRLVGQCWVHESDAQQHTLVRR